MNDKLVSAMLASAIQRAGQAARSGRADAMKDSNQRPARTTGAPGGVLLIRAVHISMGEMLEIDDDSFAAQWRELARGTIAEGAALHIRRTPAELQCMVCFEKYRPAGTAPLCPHCGSVGAKVLSGEECRVESVEVNNA